MAKAKTNTREILRNLSDAELLWNLDEKAPQVQAVICLEIGRRRLREGLPLLRARLGSDNASIREAAAEALGEIGDESSAQGLLALLLDRNQPEGVRDTCGFALARLRYGDAVAELASALGDPSPSVRICVAAALAAIGNSEVRDQVESALSIESDFASRQALKRLLNSLPKRQAERFVSGNAQIEQSLGAAERPARHIGRPPLSAAVNLSTSQELTVEKNGTARFRQHIPPPKPSTKTQDFVRAA